MFPNDPTLWALETRAAEALLKHLRQELEEGPPIDEAMMLDEGAAQEAWVSNQNRRIAEVESIISGYWSLLATVEEG